MTKRAYKLQEFVAHAANVNCLKIGRKSSGVLVTGGDDRKVNMWAIGKANAILSLSGHTSAVECVTFDSAEEVVVAGASNGTLKLWDLEEAKVVRTLTGHRSNCISVDFHPFGEFFASGSLDTNLKIWDIRRKGCIHTYKGHTKGVNCIRFSPDGRWVVSGGEDGIVKLWDLTAGKLMHDFKQHDGSQINCLDFHPYEFLLATGSADRTVKIWDLETFEMIGSAGPETSGIKSIIFTPDGRTLLSAAQDSLKVWSWEPQRCHDVVDVSWSKLADIALHEGRLLGCAFHQSFVGVWVVDLSKVAPFSAEMSGRSMIVAGSIVRDSVLGNGRGSFSSAPGNDNTGKNGTCRMSSPELLTLESSYKDVQVSSVGSEPSVTISQLTSQGSPRKATRPQTPIIVPVSSTPSSAQPEPAAVLPVTGMTVVAPLPEGIPVNGSFEIPLGVTRNPRARPRNGDRLQVVLQADAERRSRGMASKQSGRIDDDFWEGRGESLSMQSSATNASIDRGRALTPAAGEAEFHMRSGSGILSTGDFRPCPNGSGPEADNAGYASGPGRGSLGSSGTTTTSTTHSGGCSDDERRPLDADSRRDPTTNGPSVGGLSNNGRGGRRSREVSASDGMFKGDPFFRLSPGHGDSSVILNGSIYNSVSRERERAFSQSVSFTRGTEVARNGPLGLDINAFLPKGSFMVTNEKGAPAVNDVQLIEELMQQHSTMASIMQARLTNVQVVRTFWVKNDMKGAVEALEKMADHSVLVDVLSAWVDRSEIFTLEICALLLPLLKNLLTSQYDRYLTIAISVISLLLKSFGSIIQETRLAAPPAPGVDLSGEQRLDRCNACYDGFVSAREILESLIRRGGDTAKAANKLYMALLEVK